MEERWGYEGTGGGLMVGRGAMGERRGDEGPGESLRVAVSLGRWANNGEIQLTRAVPPRSGGGAARAGTKASSSLLDLLESSIVSTSSGSVSGLVCRAGASEASSTGSSLWSDDLWSSSGDGGDSSRANGTGGGVIVGASGGSLEGAAGWGRATAGRFGSGRSSAGALAFRFPR